MGCIRLYAVYAVYGYGPVYRAIPLYRPVHEDIGLDMGLYIGYTGCIPYMGLYRPVPLYLAYITVYGPL